MDLIKENLISVFVKYIILLLTCFIVGLIYSSVNISLISCLLYSVFCLVYMFFVLRKTLNTINDYSINEFFNKRINDVNSKIDGDDISHKGLLKEFNNISKLFDDAYNNGNYYICQNIATGLCDSFKNLVSNSSRIMMNDTSENKDNTNDIVDIYMNFYKNKLHLTQDCSNNHLYISLVKCQEDNLKVIIDARQKLLFEKYIEELLTLSYILDETSKASKILNEMLLMIAEYIIDKVEQTDYEESLVELITKITITKNFSNNKNYSTSINNYYKLLLSLLTKTVQNNNDEYYEYLRDNILKSTGNFSVVDSSFDDIFIYFLLYSKLLIEKKDVSKIRDYIKLYSYIEIPTSIDIKWVNYHLAYFDAIFKNFDELKRDASQYLALLVRDLIRNNISFQNIILQEYHINYYLNLDRGKDFSDNMIWMYDVLRAAIMNESMSVISFYLDELADCMISINKQDKDYQKKLFDFYISIIKYNSEFSNNKVTSLIFYEFDKTIRKIDSKHCFSNEISKYIILELKEISYFCIDRNDFIVSKCIDMLYNFLEKDNEVYFALNIKQNIVKCIYNIGLQCIENNKESLLRKISNAIGWITLNAINDKNTILYKYGLDRAIDLYNMSKYMEITKKTKIFIMTLFTTIGSYCTTEPRLYACRNTIIKAILNEDYDIIKTATEIRTKENNMWKELMKCPQSAGEAFMKEFKKQKNAKKK